MIRSYCVSSSSQGVDRLPTPRIPVTPTQASELLAEIAFAGRRRDRGRILELIANIKSSAKESERNRKCFANSGADRLLSAAFAESGDEEILSALALLNYFYPSIMLRAVISHGTRHSTS
ncbi:U-box domain-containing protein 20-like [Curcuma longa]|uniref:U-box domain-containing protein 20-like n=1 Tax=Curcuma longa TaxID=136217 RepID=UPI003D9E369A